MRKFTENNVANKTYNLSILIRHILDLDFRSIVAFALFILFVNSTFAAQEQFVNLPTRENVSVPSWVITPEKVEASVILFSGGGGDIQISEDGIGKKGNFIIRSRYHFVDNNFVVYIPDVPSDYDDLLGARIGKDHVTDVKKMIQWLREKYPDKHVWLAGTSRGTISVASVAANSDVNDGPDGIVMTATVTQETNSGKDSVYSTQVENIVVPTLLSHHKRDACYVTLFEDIDDLYDDLVRVKQKEIFAYTGGLNIGDECQGKSYHGFNGIEEEVVDDISAWIKSQ